MGSLSKLSSFLVFLVGVILWAIHSDVVVDAPRRWLCRDDDNDDDDDDDVVGRRMGGGEKKVEEKASTMAADIVVVVVVRTTATTSPASDDDGPLLLLRIILLFYRGAARYLSARFQSAMTIKCLTAGVKTNNQNLQTSTRGISSGE